MDFSPCILQQKVASLSYHLFNPKSWLGRKCNLIKDTVESLHDSVIYSKTYRDNMEKMGLVRGIHDEYTIMDDRG